MHGINSPHIFLSFSFHPISIIPVGLQPFQNSGSDATFIPSFHRTQNYTTKLVHLENKDRRKSPVLIIVSLFCLLVSCVYHIVIPPHRGVKQGVQASVWVTQWEKRQVWNYFHVGMRNYSTISGYHNGHRKKDIIPSFEYSA